MKKDFAKEYATALFDIALELKKVEIVEEQLKVSALSISESEQMIKLLNHPQISKDEKKQFVYKVFSKLDSTVLSFLYVLVDNGRLQDVSLVYEAYVKLFNQYNEVIDVIAQTTVSLTSEQIEKLKSQLMVKYRHKITIKNEINTSIVGGMRLIINDEVVDNSIKTQLSQLKSYILKQN
jgi:F-type H+-transporting ATPase subunit delta